MTNQKPKGGFFSQKGKTATKGAPAFAYRRSHGTSGSGGMRHGTGRGKLRAETKFEEE